MDLEEFQSAFEEEHRTVRDTAESLLEYLRTLEREKVQNNVNKLNKILGPHFRYESEALYPALRDYYGKIYMKRLYDSHEGTVHAVRKMKNKFLSGRYNNGFTSEAIDLVRGWIQPHVSDCEGLSIMLENVPENAINDIVEAREAAFEDDVNLIDWADDLRKRPDFATLSIYD